MAALSRDDLLALANSPRRRGRPTGSAPFRGADWALCAEMDELVAAGMLPWEAAGVVAPKALGNTPELRSKRVRLTNRYVDEYLPQRIAHRRLITFAARVARDLQEVRPPVLIPALPRVVFESPAIPKAALELSETFEATRAAVIAWQDGFSREVRAAIAAIDVQARRWTDQYKQAFAGIKLTAPGIKLTGIA